MPRAARNKKEIDGVRDKILDNALEIISTEGYDDLTMRKLGSRLGCAAKTIYNYYSSKEEIYLRILTKGFKTLNAKADAAIKSISNPIEQLRKLCNIYITFGLEYVHYYNIMFSWDVPKYTNYIGSFFESAAREEKETVMHYATISETAISELLSHKSAYSKRKIAYHLVRMWTQLHGFVTLYNSYSFREYYPHTLHFQQRIVEELIMGFNDCPLDKRKKPRKYKQEAFHG